MAGRDVAGSVSTRPSWFLSRVRSPVLVAVLLATLCTFLWAAAFIIVKGALSDVPPFTMVGVRNAIGFVLLFGLSRLVLGDRLPPHLGGSTRVKLLVMGACHATSAIVTFYVLSRLPVTTVAFFMNSTPLVAAFLGIVLLRETPTWLQGAGVGVVLVGTYLFFPSSLSANELSGIGLILIGQVTWVYSQVLVRQLMQAHAFSTVLITAISLGINTVLSLALAVAVDGPPRLSLESWGVIILLAVFTFALPATIWNQALRVLPLFQLSVMGNTQPIQSAFLAWLLLGESLTVNKVAGLIIVMLGITIVQWPRRLRPWRSNKGIGK